MKIIIETPRQELRQFTLADGAIIQALNSTTGVLKYIHEAALENVSRA